MGYVREGSYGQTIPLPEQYMKMQIESRDGDVYRCQVFVYPNKQEADANNKAVALKLPQIEFKGALAEKIKKSRDRTRACFGFLERFRYGMEMPEEWQDEVDSNILKEYLPYLENATPVLEGNQQQETPMKVSDDEVVPSKVPNTLNPDAMKMNRERK